MPSPAPDYTAYPTPADVLARVASLGVTLASTIDANQQQSRIDQVTAEVERRTRRQFLAGSPGEIRYFDGSGVGELQVDEYVSITGVVLLGYLGIPAGLSLSSWTEISQHGSPKTRVAIAQGSLPAFAPIWVAVFPEGRRNIGVTATWGYGATIPEDLWQAICDRCAQTLVAFEEYQIEGRVSSFEMGNQQVKYDLSLPEALVRADERFNAAIARYTRPIRAKLRQITRRVI